MTIHGEHAFLFKLAQEEDKVKVLDLGSVFIAKKLFLIRPWSIALEQNLDAITSFPVWMNLRKVPLYLWIELGLSRIASIVGTPIMTDTPTALKTRMSYARVLVEVAPDCEFPEELPILVDDVKLVVKAEYPWRPNACSHCKTFGHSDAKCSFIPKTKENQSIAKLVANTRDKDEDRVEQIPLVVETQITKVTTDGIKKNDELVYSQSDEVTGERVKTEVLERSVSTAIDENWQNPKKKNTGKKKGDKTVEATDVLNPYCILDSELSFANLCDDDSEMEKSRKHDKNDAQVKPLTIIDKIYGLLGDTSGKETSIFLSLNDKYQKSWQRSKKIGKEDIIRCLLASG